MAHRTQCQFYSIQSNSQFQFELNRTKAFRHPTKNKNKNKTNALDFQISNNNQMGIRIQLIIWSKKRKKKKTKTKLYSRLLFLFIQIFVHNLNLLNNLFVSFVYSLLVSFIVVSIGLIRSFDSPTTHHSVEKTKFGTNFNLNTELFNEN